MIDVGAGLSFITTDASTGNTFELNAPGEGLETISGFNAGDVLDLSRTLAGSSVASDLSNLGSYITTVSNGGSTTLLADPSGGGAGTAFAQLTGVTTTVASLVANGQVQR